ncbi:MAG TPA: hypothetical protein DD423_07135 [Opitutae bacterium]|jgi:hypothetical protein|nr:hypothetical protein [Opitutae bacterium]
MKKQYRTIVSCLLCAASLLSAFSTAQGEGVSGWGSRALSVFRGAGTSDSAAFGSAEDLAKGLREALAVSAERALQELGQAGGFLNSERFRIPLPKTVERLRKPLSLVKQDYRLDEFQTTMNRAAEQGVAAAPSIVKGAIQQLTMEDLNQLWKGEEDAITRFLEKRSRSQLAERMLPLIAAATDSTGATRSYKQMEDALPKASGGLFAKVQSFTGIGKEGSFDLDTYVNEKALDSLFDAMAAEEKAIRENPLARSTDLLQKLFKD